MGKFDRYLMKNLAIATFFIAVVLMAVVMLTQSLRFLELVIEAGASSISFWILTMLAMPRFLEIILPLSTMAAVLFVYNRMTLDSELVVIRGTGYSPLNVARSGINLAIMLVVFLYIISFFIAPYTLSSMQKMRQEVKAQFSTVLFREGVFNQVGEDLTVYIRDRGDNNEMRGILIYDNRKENPAPSMIVARHGALLMNDTGAQVVVYDGSRQELDRNKRILQTLNFERYTIDLPDAGPVRTRWKEPEERNIIELFRPDQGSKDDVDNLRDFQVEIHKRFTSPLMVLVFTLVVCASLLIGPIDRRGQGRRIVFAIFACVSMQGIYLSAYNIARQHDYGFLLMYGIVILPAICGMFFLCPQSETFRRKVFYRISGSIRKRELS